MTIIVMIIIIYFPSYNFFKLYLFTTALLHSLQICLLYLIYKNWLNVLAIFLFSRLPLLIYLLFFYFFFRFINFYLLAIHFAFLSYKFFDLFGFINYYYSSSLPTLSPVHSSYFSRSVFYSVSELYLYYIISRIDNFYFFFYRILLAMT